MPSDPDAVRAYFLNFGEKQAPANGSPLYELLATRAADDAELIALAARCPASQPSANLLFAAVHYLLLAGDPHALREFYPDVLAAHESARPADEQAWSSFRAFVAEHRAAIDELLCTRLVQTNVVRRTTVLLPLFAEAARAGGGAPLALLEVGASAGLNLHWDRHRHRHDLASGELRLWGPPDAGLELQAFVRGPPWPPRVPEDLAVAWRQGVDLHPIDTSDADATRWLHALVFPEHVERHHEIESAARVAREHPAPVEAGDATVLLPDLLARAPHDATLVVYATMVLNQIRGPLRERLLGHLADASRARPIFLITLDGNNSGFASLRLAHFAGGPAPLRELALAHAHGRWLAWR